MRGWERLGRWCQGSEWFQNQRDLIQVSILLLMSRVALGKWLYLSKHQSPELKNEYNK